jgi:hypothetical protein
MELNVEIGFIIDSQPEILLMCKLCKDIKDEFNLEGDWYFLSYSSVPYPIPLGWLFRNDSNVILKLTNVHLQFKNSFVKEIPPGWKTICQFDIKGEINIGESDTWKRVNDSQIIYPFSKAEMREKQIKSVIE